MNKQALAFVIVLILIIFLIAWTHYDSYEKYLDGCWIATDDFCEQSQIESMMIYVGESAGWWSRTRICYIVIMDDMCNQGFTLRYSLPASLPLNTYEFVAEAEFDAEDLWGGKVNIAVDMAAGTMIISQNNVIYARLYKHHDITNMTKYLSAVDMIDGDNDSSDDAATDGPDA